MVRRHDTLLNAGLMIAVPNEQISGRQPKATDAADPNGGFKCSKWCPRREVMQKYEIGRVL
jgi:hypothetical protein